MALRIATLETQPRTAPPRTAREWQRAVARAAAAAAEAVRARDPGALARAYAEAGGFDDPHRAFQARRLATEAVLAEGARLPGLSWRPVYAAAARALLDALEEAPSEPVLLNCAGVFCYELGELRGARALFEAARRLDPALPHVAANLDAVRARARSGGGRPPGGPALAALGARARRVARAARPAEGLTLSLCMIVRDEEEMLPGCLEPVAGVVDEIVVVDTGSTDRTVEIAERFGARVLRFPWNGSFADARNASLDAATGDWVLYLDADEHLVPEDAPKLRGLLGRTWREGFHLVETNYTGGEDAGTAVTHLALRLFRNRPEYRFEGRIHEQKTGRMPTYLPERFEATTIRLRHYGYLASRIGAKEKSRRNVELLEREAREAPGPFTWFNLGSEHLMLGDAARAAEHFDRAWEELHAAGDWTSVGYAPILASRIAAARRQAGRLADARAALEAGLAAMPDHTDLHFELALCAAADGDLAEAERLARRCLELGDAPARYASVVGTGTYLALCLLGELAERGGRPDEAERLYRRSLAEHPSYVAPVLPAAALLLARGAPLGELREALPLERPGATLLAATACLEAGRLDDAVALFRETLERRPGNDAARIGLAEAFLASRSWEEAAAAAAAVPPASPLAAEAARELLFARAAAGDEPALRAALADAEARGLAAPERALYAAWADVLAGAAPAPVPPAALPAAATALEALLRVREFVAFERLAAVLEAIPVPADDRRDLLARIYLRRGFLDSAADEWLASVRERPSARALVGLAQVAYAHSLPDDAAVFAGHALDLDPGHEPARILLERLRERAA